MHTPWPTRFFPAVKVKSANPVWPVAINEISQTGATAHPKGRFKFKNSGGSIALIAIGETSLRDANENVRVSFVPIRHVRRISAMATHQKATKRPILTNRFRWKWTSAMTLTPSHASRDVCCYQRATDGTGNIFPSSSRRLNSSTATTPETFHSGIHEQTKNDTWTLCSDIRLLSEYLREL